MQKLPIILDGSMGINLMRAGLPDGVCVEQWLLEHPAVFMKLLAEYADAGSDIVYAPTFGANRFKLARFGLADKTREINMELVRLSKEAVQGRAKVFGDLSPSGGFVVPIGTLTFDELTEAFEEQICACKDAGADGVVIETQMTVSDLRASLIAAKKLQMPAYVTVTVNEHGKMLDGTDFASVVVIAQSLGAEAVGMNCSDGPEKMIKNLGRGYDVARIPLIAKPNAGMPDPETGLFPYTPDKFASYAEPLMREGASVLGGCCGTEPSHIAALAEAVKTLPCPAVKTDIADHVATAHQVFRLDGLTVPGEEIAASEWLIDDCEEASDCDYLVIRIEDEEGLNAFCESISQLQLPVLLTGEQELVQKALLRYDGVALNYYENRA